MPEDERLHGEEFATERSEPYWRALHAGKLELQRCRRCRRYQHYPRVLCRHCGGTDLEWAPASPAGTVVSAVLTHRTSKDSLNAKLPYLIVLVRLEDGPILMATADNDVSPGTRAEIDFGATKRRGLLTLRTL